MNIFQEAKNVVISLSPIKINFKSEHVYEFQKKSKLQDRRRLIFIRRVSGRRKNFFLFRAPQATWIESFTQEQMGDYEIIESSSKS
jgi:hypothetical protein